MGTGVTAPRDFLADGLSCGIKKSGKPDLAVLLSGRPAVAAAVFTRHSAPSAGVILGRRLVRRAKHRGVLINSGCANAATGRRGAADIRRVLAGAERVFGLASGELLPASTGIVGVPLPVDKILKGLGRLRPKAGGGGRAARAILTTDPGPKEASLTLRFRGRTFRLGGMAKGAGMIHPNMATLIVVLTTDAAASKPVLTRLLRKAVDRSFNSMTVDQDQSTNDSCFLLANGAAGTPSADSLTSPWARILGEALEDLCGDLARRVAREAEGAKKLITVTVEGARSESQAAKIARSVASSSLVKAAAASGDPNWGRIFVAAGNAGQALDPYRLRIWMGGRLFYKGGPLLSGKSPSLIKGRDVALKLDLGLGKARALAWGCDLTEDYVRINMDYS